MLTFDSDMENPVMQLYLSIGSYQVSNPFQDSDITSKLFKKEFIMLKSERTNAIISYYSLNYTLLTRHLTCFFTLNLLEFGILRKYFIS